jgi:hypothetical protein
LGDGTRRTARDPSPKIVTAARHPDPPRRVRESRVAGRPARALPTNRVKFEKQKKTLNAIAIQSEFGKRGVNGADIAPWLGVVPATASLSNRFFEESGLVEWTGKGRYRATDPTNEFARRYNFGDVEDAGRCLRGVLAETWYYEVVATQLGKAGMVSASTLIEALMVAAEATPDYRVQIGTLLSWLEFATLIVRGGEHEDHYRLASGSERGTAGAAAVGESARSDEDALVFGFNLSMSYRQIQGLTPEQASVLSELFDAVDRLVSLQAAEH